VFVASLEVEFPFYRLGHDMTTEGSSNAEPRIAASEEEISRFPIVAGVPRQAAWKRSRKLLAGVPADLDMAFVLIPHLDPQHPSLMVEILTG